MSKSQYANWYADRRWRRIRREHLAGEPLCRMCKTKGRITTADVVDHVTPHRGNRHAFWYGERQSLCHRCHSSEKQRQELGLQHKGCDEHGWLNPTGGHPRNFREPL